MCREWRDVVDKTPKDPDFIPHAFDIVKRGTLKKSDKELVLAMGGCKSRCAELFYWRFENITKLNFSDRTGLTNVTYLGQCKMLTKLDLWGCRGVTDVSCLG